MTLRRTDTHLTSLERTSLLLEEYRALYGLLTFRLGAIDQRILLVAGTLVALVGSLSTLAVEQRLAVLLGLPAGCVWLYHTTLLHTRSKEDLLRRIDLIERQVNRLAGEEMLVFQSRHPNRKGSVGGRSGFGSVVGILAVSVCLIVGGVFLFWREFPERRVLVIAYSSYALLTLVALFDGTARLAGYRSTKSTQADPPVFEAH